jgi:hypothetical protein
MPKISVKPRMGRPRQVVQLTPEPAFTEPEPAASPADLNATEALDEETAETLEPLASRVVVPAPPQFRFDTDSPRGRRPEDFFAYWNSLADGYKKWVMCYVYRNWPVIQIMIPDKKHGGVKPTYQIEKLPGEDVIHSMDELVQRYGSGDYTLRLNRQKPSQPIALCTIRGIRDMEFHPPCYPHNLMDVLVMDDPANRDFINQLRLKGAWRDKEMEEQEMAAGEVTQALTGTIERLSDKLAEKKEPAPAPAASATDAAKETVAMAREVFKEGIELGKATSAAQADAKVAAAQSGQQSPSQALGFFKEVADIIRSTQVASTSATTPATGSLGEALKEISNIYSTVLDREAKLHGTIMGMMESRVQGLEKLIQDRAAAPAQTQASGQKDDLSASLDKLLSMKEKFNNLFGGGESDEKEDKLPAWMSVLQSVTSVLPSVATAALAASYNMAIAKTGNGIPIPPTAPTEQAALPAAAEASTDAGKQPGVATIPPFAVAFLKEIEGPFLNYLNDPEKTGVDFAEVMKKWLGDIKYQAVREAGKDTLIALLHAYPPTATVVSRIPERTSEFLDDFLNAEEILAAEEGDDEPPEGVRVFVAPEAGAAQVVDLPPIVQAQEGAKSRRKVAPAAV